MSQREIKFRAWNKMQPEMRYDIQEEEDFRSYLCDGGHVVLQYTGLKDKHGREIYDGDIIKYLSGYNIHTEENNICRIGEIQWCTSAQFIISYHSAGCNYAEDMPNPGHEKDYEVIGNIYEQPGLLKEVI